VKLKAICCAQEDMRHQASIDLLEASILEIATTKALFESSK
jgi:hypothetical protein